MVRFGHHDFKSTERSFGALGAGARAGCLVYNDVINTVAVVGPAALVTLSSSPQFASRACTLRCVCRGAAARHSPTCSAIGLSLTTWWRGFGRRATLGRVRVDPSHLLPLGHRLCLHRICSCCLFKPIFIVFASQ